MVVVYTMVCFTKSTSYDCMRFSMSQHKSSLVCRNVVVNGHRTSIRLEPTLWQALDYICKSRSCHINDICSEVADMQVEGGFTSAVRTFVVSSLLETSLILSRKMTKKSLGGFVSMRA
jgi:predicted DNA-binding ribbon-helix-helix protein